MTNVAKIECKLHCIMVKIGYTDELKPLLGDDTEVTVTINSNDQLTFKMEMKYVLLIFLPMKAVILSISNFEHSNGRWNKR